MNEKKTFTGFTKIAKVNTPIDDCHYFTFKLWKKNNTTRIYIKDYKGRTIGYIENKTVQKGKKLNEYL